MDDTNGSHAHHVREPGTRSGMLAVAGFASQLGGDLADLSDTGGADGVANR
jgi:hypothetical protein